ncbi:MAG: acetylornithine transaminase [Clostridia bacterium]|jgi:acetylornithine/N-succinyldiaminopimelate aminotransferase|nr:acetylornithine transaminase [Clostridiaceae bacterium]
MTVQDDAKLQKIIDLDKKYYMNTFGNRTPVCFEKGEGVYLYDTKGKKYCDLLAGIAVNCLGHNHHALVEAIKSQAEKLIHCSSLYYIEKQAELAQKLVSLSCCDKVFFSNSGAEANEGAIKLARLYFQKRGLKEKYEIITLEKSFHGRTLATLAATGQEKYHKSYKPLPEKFVSVPANDIDALKGKINENTCAVMMEPIQGEGGINIVDADYAKKVRLLCDQYDLLLIFDEVQCGIGRTGKMFGYEHFGIEPDIFTLAKALGGGVPIGAFLAKEFVAKAMEPGDHGSTFGGNPLACAAALAVLNTIEKDGLLKNVEAMGAYMTEKLNEIAAKTDLIKEVRGKGLMIGIEFTSDIAAAVKDALLEKGFLVGTVGSRVIRLTPPLIIKKEDTDPFFAEFEQALTGGMKQ